MNKKLSSLYKELSKKGADYYLLSSSDEFLNEFIPDNKMRLKWLINFSGSNGIALLSLNRQIFFTDGRYLVQAKKELEKNFEIIDLNKINLQSFVKKELMKKKIILDTKTFNKNFVQELIKFGKKNKNIIAHDKFNLVDKIWLHKDFEKPKKFFKLEEKFVGVSSEDKIKKIRDLKKNYDFVIISSPDSVCWLLNIRGKDLLHTPVVMSRAIISKNVIKFFVDIKKLPTEKFAFYNKEIKIIDINSFEKELRNIPQNSNVFLDDQISYFYYKLTARKKINIYVGTDPCKILRSKKNLTEINFAKKSHIYDGIALVKFFSWLSKQKFGDNLTEYSVSLELERFRKKNINFFSLSFPTISAVGSNGSIIHYKPKKDSSILQKRQLFLCDSGGQYFGATTDVTRTIILGPSKPPREYIKFYTYVLIGHINISMLKFPIGTKGHQIDILGRHLLWNLGLDYDHGTGHGVGSFLCVHEGPQNISKKFNDFCLEEGMILSNEPGYYKDGKFGIRIENLLFVKPSRRNGFLEFETLTLCPYDRNLIDKQLMSKMHIEWLNNYHSNVYKKISRFLSNTEKAWLKQKTKEI